ncbi:MAG: leucine-rich repeat domain-containing protein [Microcoleaceae cyanobacterium]
MQRQIWDLSFVSSLNHLTGLNLTGNQITNIQPLTQLTDLTFLLLTDNQRSDITPLSQLTRLSYVTIDRNNIQTLPTLPTFKKLTALGLMDNPIAQKQCPVQPATICLFSNEVIDQFAAAEEQYQAG